MSKYFKLKNKQKEKLRNQTARVSPDSFSVDVVADGISSAKSFSASYSGGTSDVVKAAQEALFPPLRWSTLRGEFVVAVNSSGSIRFFRPPTSPR